MISIYPNVIADLEHRINPYQLAVFATKTAEEMPDKDEALKFLASLRGKVKESKPATVLIMSKAANRQVLAGDFDAAKETIEEARKFVDQIEQVSEAHAHFYSTASEYYRLEGTHSQYFREALKYLGVVQLDALSHEERRNCAGRLAVAAIMAENIFSFGELLVHPIVAALKSPRDQWLYDLLGALNTGDSEAVDKLKPQWSHSVPEMAQNEKIILQKVRLMALIEMSYRRKPDDRTLTFAQIADATRVPETDVRHAVLSTTV